MAALATSALPAARMALSAAREEATLLSSELSAVSRSGLGHAVLESGASMGVQAEVHALNPAMVRQAAKEAAGGESSILSRLAHPPTGSASPQPLQSLSSTTLESALSGPAHSLPVPSATSSFTSMLSGEASTSAQALRQSSTVTRAIEQDLGATLREVLSNAGQQGVEEVGDQVPLAQVVAEFVELRGGDGLGQVAHAA